MAHDIGDQTLVGDQPLLDAGDLQKSYASLVVLQGAEIGREFRLRRGRMIVGRGLEADVRLLDDHVSREHARIELLWDPATRESHYILVDLGSTNRTFVNSRQIQRVELLDGDKIHLGNSVLKFVLLDDIEAKFHAEIRSRISYDRLTGLLTRESLYLALHKELQRCGRYRLPLAVLMMDLDRFKSVNDAHGHPIGSRVLTETAKRIRESLRARDVSARYGGDEFITYLSETGKDIAGLTAQRIRQAIASRPFEIDARSIDVSISIGVATFPDHGRSLESLVKRADAALYLAKEEGRNRVAIAQGSPGRRRAAKNPRARPPRKRGRGATTPRSARSGRPRAHGRGTQRRRSAR